MTRTPAQPNPLPRWRLATLAAGAAALLSGCDMLPRLDADPRPATGGWGVTTRDPTTDGPATRGPARTPTSEIARTQMQRARELAGSGEIEAAIQEFEQIIAENPTLTTAYLGAGDLYMEQGNLPEAESRFARAAQLEPRNFEAQYKHGLVLQLMERTVDSVRAYLRALAIQPNDYEANLNLASAYLQLQEPAQAEPYARRAVNLRPDSGEARVNLGSALAAQNRHREAVIEYRQAAELMELTPELLLNLADSLGQTGSNAEMAATLQELIRLEPSATAYERLGAALFRLRRYEEALAAFQSAVDLDPAHYPAWNGIAVSQLNNFLWSEQTDEQARRAALEAMRNSLRIEPSQPRIVELLRRYS